MRRSLLVLALALGMSGLAMAVIGGGHAVVLSTEILLPVGLMEDAKKVPKTMPAGGIKDSNPNWSGRTPIVLSAMKGAFEAKI